MKRRYGRIAIIGVGLIGGSIGMALRKKKLAKEVVGVGHRLQSIKKAIRLKTIDKGTLNLKKGVKDADIVILATPILTIPDLVRRIKNSVKKGCVITDAGSVKSHIVKRVEKMLAEGISFVGAHPMAGSEERGVEKAKEDLFLGSACILTKTGNTDVKSLEIMKNLWEDLGTKVIVLSAETHDRIVSKISHLPHIVVFTLLNSIDAADLKFASSGFLDTTRIASSDAKIWKDIAISNRDEILKSIKTFKNKLALLEKAIQNKDSGKLISIFKSAKIKRDSLKKKKHDNSHRWPGGQRKKHSQ